MPPTNADRLQPVTQPGADRATVSISDAARALGLSTDAIRSRLRRGTLPGEKVDGEWRIFLPNDSYRNSIDEPRPVDQPVSDRSRPVNRPDVDNLAAMLERADQEIAWLREQLEARGREVAERSRELAAERERSDVLHREAFARIEALTGGLAPREESESNDIADDNPPAPARTPPADDDHLARVQAFVAETKRAPASPQTAQDGPGATMAPSASNESNEDVRHPPRTGFWDFWARLFGR